MRMSTFSRLLLLIGTFYSASGFAQRSWVALTSPVPQEVKVDYLGTVGGNPQIRFLIPGYWSEEIHTPQGRQQRISLEGGAACLLEGAPDLPTVSASLIIADRGAYRASVLNQSIRSFANQSILPSKGNLPRTIRPSDVPYRYGKVYQNNEFWPSASVELRNPHILRDHRGQTVVFSPFRFNPVSGELQVSSELTMSLEPDPQKAEVNPFVRNHTPVSTDPYYHAIYANHFKNYPSVQYLPLADEGRMLIICHSPWMPIMQELVDWKIKRGMEVQMVDVITAGGSEQGIRNYILNEYMTNGLSFVLLVGDYNYIPTPTLSGGASDPSYGYISGNDSYAELMVGRFSAESNDDVITQVQRVINYERYPQAATPGFDKAVVIGSDQGPGDDNEMDWEHAANMRTDLLNHGMSLVSELYDGTHPGTTDAPGDPVPGDLFNLFQDGIALMTYTGHGSNNSCSTTGLSNSEVLNMTNFNRLPYIFSVACVNGNFNTNFGPCFAETFLRAQQNGQPTGAIATLMSSINQSWSPPMDGQDEMIDLITNTSTSGYRRTFGSVSVNGCMHMNDQYAQGGYEMTDTWHIFGDPSLQIRTAIPQAIAVSHPAALPLGTNQISLTSANDSCLVALSMNGQLVGTGIITGGVLTINTSALNAIDTLWVTATGFNKIPYEGYILIIPASGPWVLSTSHSVQDPGGNQNGLMDYAETVELDLVLSNLGLSDATAGYALLSTADAYVYILNDSVALPTILAGAQQNLSSAFSWQVAGNIPDQHTVVFNLTVYDGNGASWNSIIPVQAQAPRLEGGSYWVDDAAAGDGDGMLEPGETADIHIRCENIGHSASTLANAVLSSVDPQVSVAGTGVSLGILPAQSYFDAVFSVSLAPNMSLGTSYILALNQSAGMYSDQTYYAMSAGLIVEDFETGNLNRFNWITGGNANWVVNGSQVYEGLYSATNDDINDSESAFLSLTVNVQADDSVSFWYRTDSEQDWDFLHFYVDGVEMGFWSGLTPWSYAGFPVSAGIHEFQFVYSKDNIISSGADAVWVDNIRLPLGATLTSVNSSVVSTNTPVIYPNPSSSDFYILNLPYTADVQPYELIDMSGRVVQSGQVRGAENARISIKGIANGSYLLRFPQIPQEAALKVMVNR